MSPRHFSSRGGPYFINDGFTNHQDHIDVSTTSVSFIGRVRAFFKSRLKTKTNNPIRHYDRGQKIAGSFAGSKDSITKLPPL
jgi:hypothetical protein